MISPTTSTTSIVTPLSPSGSSVRIKEEIFNNLLVNVADEGLDLYDGLGYFLDDTIEFEGGTAEMEIDILELPPILHIQLQVCLKLVVYRRAYR